MFLIAACHDIEIIDSGRAHKLQATVKVVHSFAEELSAGNSMISHYSSIVTLRQVSQTDSLITMSTHAGGSARHRVTRPKSFSPTQIQRSQRVTKDSLNVRGEYRILREYRPQV